jgi:hypothetical protein
VGAAEAVGRALQRWMLLTCVPCRWRSQTRARRGHQTPARRTQHANRGHPARVCMEWGGAPLRRIARVGLMRRRLSEQYPSHAVRHHSMPMPVQGRAGDGSQDPCVSPAYLPAGARCHRTATQSHPSPLPMQHQARSWGACWVARCTQRSIHVGPMRRRWFPLQCSFPLHSAG